MHVHSKSNRTVQMIKKKIQKVIYMFLKKESMERTARSDTLMVHFFMSDVVWLRHVQSYCNVW